MLSQINDEGHKENQSGHKELQPKAKQDLEHKRTGTAKS
jgi:hypothetical protein